MTPFNNGNILYAADLNNAFATKMENSNPEFIGSLNANGTVGSAGQALTSAGVGAPAVWSDVNPAPAIHAATSKTTPVDADELAIVDSAASNVLKKLTWANLKATLLPTWKDVTGGLVGLTLFKINFKNTANTFTSFLTNSNTAVRTYTFQDRNGIIADDSDIALLTPKVQPTTSFLWTHTGDVLFSGLNRIFTADFSNATLNNRFKFMTSTLGGDTTIPAGPQGSGVSASWQVENSPVSTNASYGKLSINSSYVSVVSDRNGSGSYLPLGFYTNGVLRATINTAGFLGINTVPLTQLHIIAANPGTPTTSGSNTDGVSFRAQSASVNMDFGTYGSGVCFIQPRLAGDNSSNFNLSLCPNGGNVIITGPGLFGYGPGAGGTVTQATSKTTAVTLNKTSGKITTHNAALASGASVIFTLNNSVINPSNIVVASHSETGGTVNAYIVDVLTTGTGYTAFRVTNISGGSLSEAIDIMFSVQKGITS